MLSRMSWADVARGQGGAIARAQLRAAGLSDDRIDRLIAGGALTRLARGVLLARAAPPTYEVRLWSAILASGGVLGYGTAAHLWGALDEPPAAVHVVIAPGRRITRPPGVTLHRVPLPTRTQPRRHGLPVVDRATAVLDHLTQLQPAEADQLADRALQRGWLTRDDVTRRLRTQPGRTGNRGLRRLEGQLRDGAAARSERLLHQILRRAQIGGWVANYDLWLDGTLVAVIDVAFPRLRLALEVDGWAFHSDVERFRRDRRRQNGLVLARWTVLRFTWADLTERPGYVVATIRLAIAES